MTNSAHNSAAHLDERANGLAPHGIVGVHILLLVAGASNFDADRNCLFLTSPVRLVSVDSISILLIGRRLAKLGSKLLPGFKLSSANGIAFGHAALAGRSDEFSPLLWSVESHRASPVQELVTQRCLQRLHGAIDRLALNGVQSEGDHSILILSDVAVRKTVLDSDINLAASFSDLPL